jgi:hypothetical protein
MQRRSAFPIGRNGLVLAIAIIVASSIGTGYCPAAEVALLLQQSPAQGGVIIPDVGMYRFAPDEEVAIEAVPKSGYEFVYWLGDVVDPTASKTVAYLNKPNIIIAVFQPITYESLLAGGGISRGVRTQGLFHGVGLGSDTEAFAGSVSTSTDSRGRPTADNTEGQAEPIIPPEPVVPPIPEPATILLLGLGGLALLRNRRG